MRTRKERLQIKVLRKKNPATLPEGKRDYLEK